MNSDFDTDLWFSLNGMLSKRRLVELIEFPFPLPLKHAMSCIYKQTNKQTNKNLDL